MRMKKQASSQEKILASYLSDKELISSIYKQFSNSIIINNPFF